MPWIETIAEPDDASAYTHKLDLELGAGLGLFNWLPKGNWLKNVTGYVTLDYLVTGLPDEGDEAPQGALLYLEAEVVR